MKGKRLALVSLLSAALLAFAVEPVAAQSTSIDLIDNLNEKLLLVGVPIAILVEAILIYTVFKFKDNDKAQPTRENRRLEITWTIATAIILLFVGAASYGVLANEDITYTADDPVAPENDDVVVQADAFQWGWNMSYPQHGFSNGNEIVIPADQDVYFVITSQDVLHGFAVPELGLKQDAIPGQENVIRTVPTEPGTYQGYCTEYCGVAHSQMYFTVEVLPQDEYDQWVQDQTSSDNSSASLDSPDELTALAN
ncbi:cytochrome c oxidase subunit 2 [Halogranum gelatinilyticum]|uniref:cytochrome-c oxidase n=1 Tax=Halogranum gelatinilyticum TaxID=660521 RepID=A0A1G9R9V7_9EURY|nr:cytochrome c oxidase subunit II [Halogranum gelatinilyticum]SDM19185.1 cytochrome c oxidase subunit 2 [Halogranum gelatinilyticum]